MKKLFIFLCSSVIFLSEAQNLKVTYVCSSFLNNSRTVDKIENVYYKNGYKISITDSISLKKYDQKEDGSIRVVEKSKIFRKVIVNNPKTKDLYFTYAFNNQNYFVHDEMPEIKWKISANETKKIGKYLCKKATTTYRGTELEAYFTTEIPVSLAPHKLSGLPGLVMEMRSFGQIYYIWTVKNIEFPYNGVPNYSPKYLKSLRPIEIKDLVKKIDDKIEEEFNIQQSKLEFPAGVKLSSVNVVRVNPRRMLETKFEWEK